MSAARAAATRVRPGRGPKVPRAGKGRPARSGSGSARSSSHAGRHRRRRSDRTPIARAPRLSRLPFLIASFVLVGMLVVGVASLQAVVSQGSFRMQDLTRHNIELQQEYGRLKLEVAELSAPGRIAARARRLGFRLPQPGDVSTLRVKGTGRANTGAGQLNGPALSLRSLLERRP